MTEYASGAGTAIRAGGEYRYVLTRDLAPLQHEAGEVCWVMLNPSVADERWDDATVRRCSGFTKRWGYARLSAVNLFAFIATEPAALRAQIERAGVDAAVGPDNNRYLGEVAARSRLIVVAWGARAALRRPPGAPAPPPGVDELCPRAGCHGTLRHVDGDVESMRRCDDCGQVVLA